MENIKLMCKLRTYNRPIEIKKYHLIGIPLDAVVPFTFGAITIILSKFKRFKPTIWRIDRNVFNKRRKMQFNF